MEDDYETDISSTTSSKRARGSHLSVQNQQLKVSDISRHHVTLGIHGVHVSHRVGHMSVAMDTHVGYHGYTCQLLLGSQMLV